MSLNIYYVGMSIYGFWLWRKGERHTEETKVEIAYRHIIGRMVLGIMFVTALLFGGMYFILSRFTDSPLPAGDAFTTALSITATWMLARKILEHWWFWVIINIVSAVLYYQRELYPTCFLFICYGILAVVGWVNWKRKGLLYDRKV